MTKSVSKKKYKTTNTMPMGTLFNGTNSGAYCGSAVKGVGDVNGDGIDDFLIGSDGTITNSPTNYNYEGAAFLIFGSKQPYPTPFQLSTINGNSTLGVVFTAAASSTSVGCSVSDAGDVNNDGRPDFLIGSYPFGYDGNIYLIYGRNLSNPFPSKIFLDNLGVSDNTTGVVFQSFGNYDGGNYCFSVSSTGDVNGDRIDDFLIGDAAEGYDTGAVYLVYGRNSSNIYPSTFSLSNLGTPGNKDGVLFEGNYPSDTAIGFSVSGVGDVNQDKVNDFLIGAPWNQNNGFRFLIYGRPEENPFPSSFLLNNLGETNNTDGVYFLPPSGAWGESLSGVGDVNNDGIPDFLFGSNNAYNIAAYLLYGRIPSNPFPPSYQLSILGTPGNTDGVVFEVAANAPIPQNSCFWVVSGAGDVNKDGMNDMLIGCPVYGGEGQYGGTIGNGVVYLVPGRNSATNPFPPTFELTGFYNVSSLTTTNSNGTSFYGGNDYNLGQAIGDAGDVNNDGYADFLMGAPYAPQVPVNVGNAYLVYGQPQQNEVVEDHKFLSEQPIFSELPTFGSSALLAMALGHVAKNIYNSIWNLFEKTPTETKEKVAENSSTKPSITKEQVKEELRQLFKEISALETLHDEVDFWYSNKLEDLKEDVIDLQQMLKRPKCKLYRIYNELIELRKDLATLNDDYFDMSSLPSSSKMTMKINELENDQPATSFKSKQQQIENSNNEFFKRRQQTLTQMGNYQKNLATKPNTQLPAITPRIAMGNGR